MDGNEQDSAVDLKEIFERLLAIQTEDLDDDIIVAFTLTRMGITLMEQGNLDEALEKLNRALAIRMEKLGEHNDTSETYAAIGCVFAMQGNFEKAEEMFREALDIKRKLLPNDHYDLITLYQGLTYSLKKQGKYSAATKIYKLQLGAILEMHGEYHPDVVVAYNGIAQLLFLLNRLDDALQLLDRGIEICNHLQQLEGFDIAILETALNNQARALKAQGNLVAATEAFNRVLVIQMETLGEMHPKTAETYEQLGQAYVRQEMVERAIEAYAKAVKIRRKELGNDHRNVKELVFAVEVLELEKNVAALNEQGLAMKAEGDLEKAEQLFQEALELYLGTSNFCTTMAVVLENISDVRVDMGLLEDAIVVSAEALRIRRRMHGDDDADTKRRIKVHRSLLKRLLENRS